MGKVVWPVRRRKKSRRLGQVEVVDRSGYEALDLDAKAALILEVIPVGLMRVQELLEAEVEQLFPA